MNSRTLRALEFGRLLEHLASFAVSESGKSACLALLPLPTPADALAAHRLCAEVGVWLAATGFRLDSFLDMRPVFALLDEGAFVEADAFWALRGVLTQARDAVIAIRAGADDWPDLAALAQSAPLPEMTVAALNRCLTDDGLLRDESSPELLAVRQELRRLHQECLRRVKDFATEYNIARYLQDDFMTLASDRYVLPLKSNFKGHVQGIVHDYSNTGETCYFEPLFLMERNNRLQDLKRQEREEERRVLAMLAGIAVAELPFLRAAWDLLVRLDVEMAKRGLGAALDAVTPSLGESGEPLSIMAARHPLLALDPVMRKRGGPQPVDLVLRPEDRGLVISGGNAGGKTVCLKTLGLLTAMSLAGLPIPAASGSMIPWWPDIHAFIGDEQSLDSHLSTFTAQIRHLAEAWEKTGPASLILLDEFGAGTDPSQGAALAQAVLDGLMERGACVVAATHFPALKAYALSQEGVRAASVMFDPSTHQALFRLAYDQVGASRALDVAREHGLPESVMRRAQQYLLLDGEETPALLDRLNALAARREKEIRDLEDEKAKTREKRQSLSERLERERVRLGKDVQELSRRILKDWEEGRLAHRQAMKELARVRAEVSKPAEMPEDKPASQELDLSTLQVGQEVRHRPWNKRAVVREVDVKQGRVRLDLNGVTLWADRDQVELTGGKKSLPPPAPSGAAVRRPSAELSRLRLDLRGKRADLALGELSRYLDQALLAGRESVEIVHGRGTGVLRREVHGLLRTFPGVASFELAPEDQGGDGVTIVVFR